MSFTKFLMITESSGTNRSTLVYQSFLDNMERSHYDSILDDNDSTSRITYSIGAVTSVSDYMALKLSILPSNHNYVKFGQLNGDNHIVVGVESTGDGLSLDLSKLRSMLASSSVFDRVVEYIDYYYNNYRPSTYSTDTETNNTPTTPADESASFEIAYAKVVAKINSKLSDTEDSIQLLRNDLESTKDNNKILTINAAIKKLEDESSLSTAKDFVKFANSIMAELYPEYKETFTTDQRKLFDSRMRVFYSMLQN